jgi:aspartate/methionine/tyrosine aminotransferase
MNLIVLNDPCNPSGVKFSAEILAGIVKILSRPEYSHVMVASDETYHELVYGENKVISLFPPPSSVSPSSFLPP